MANARVQRGLAVLGTTILGRPTPGTGVDAATARLPAGAQFRTTTTSGRSGATVALIKQSLATALRASLDARMLPYPLGGRPRPIPT